MHFMYVLSPIILTQLHPDLLQRCLLQKESQIRPDGTTTNITGCVFIYCSYSRLIIDNLSLIFLNNKTIEVTLCN